MKKKGISPLIATVILIAFTIAIAVTVSQFTIKTVEKELDILKDYSTESLYCDNIAVTADICKFSTDNYQIVSLTNRGTLKMTDFVVIGKSKESLGDGISPGDNKIIGFNVDLSSNEVKRIDIIPFIEIDEEKIACVASKYVVSEEILNNLADC